MKLTVVNSGSKGNCYVLHNGHEALMIEAGVPFSEVIQTVGRDVYTSIKGCIVTHEHQDHAKYVKDVLDHAIPVYATSGTIGALKGKSSRIRKPVNFRLAGPDDTMAPWEQFMVGGFTVLPFRTVHDASSPCGFLIQHDDMGTTLFVTDSMFVPATFRDLNHIMIECNYDEELLRARTDIPQSLKNRIATSHQNIDTCIRALEQNDLSKVRNIMLIHISEKDGDAEAFRDRVDERFGRIIDNPVWAAHRHRTYDWGLYPY